MKFIINNQEVEQDVFFNTFYATSLNAKNDDIALVFMRGLAEALLEKEEMETFTKNIAQFYTVSAFNRQTTHVVAGNVFRIEEEFVDEPEVEVAAETVGQ